MKYKHKKTQNSPILLSLVLASLGSAPGGSKTLDVCFSPVGHCDQVLISWIRAAEKTIDGAIYNLTDPGITDALIQAHRRGIHVRIVKDRGQNLTEKTMLRRLREAGVKFKTQKGTGGGLLHDKFMIIDSKYVITGSYNWTRSAARRNDENFVILDDQTARFMKEFQRLWREGPR